MTQRIRIAIAGIAGRMGRASAYAVLNDSQLELVAAVAREGSPYVGAMIGELLHGQPCELKISGALNEAVEQGKPQVLLDFTKAVSAFEHAMFALETQISPVIGTSGLSEEQVSAMGKRSRDAGVGAMIVPNFSLGAVLMMEFAAKAGKFFSNAEIVETHHTKKLDSPSGTAMYTAKKMVEEGKRFNISVAGEHEVLAGSRGANYGDSGLRIHSLRLPGIISQQEVMLASDGEMLSIRHQSFNTNCFVPGILMAVKAVRTLDRLTVGLEHLLESVAVL